jgi:hypothetical protein
MAIERAGLHPFLPQLRYGGMLVQGALAVLYEALSHNDSDDQVDLGAYIGQIASAIMQAHAVEGIRLDTRIDTWPVTVNDDGDVRNGINVDITTIVEGTTGPYTCTDLWNEGTCGASCTAGSLRVGSGQRVTARLPGASWRSAPSAATRGRCHGSR